MPLTSATLLLSLGRTLSLQDLNLQITQSSIYVVAIMLVTYFAGYWVMQSFGVSIPGLRIAGGLIVAFIGFTMLFPPQSEDEMHDAEANAESLARRKPVHIAFVPLALPRNAGPGPIALLIRSAPPSRPANVPSSTMTI